MLQENDGQTDIM